MAELNTQTCDVCGTIRRDANHWFHAGVVKVTNLSRKSWQFVIAPWEGWLPAETVDHMHLCSENCAAKAMSKVIGSGK